LNGARAEIDDNNAPVIFLQPAPSEKIFETGDKVPVLTLAQTPLTFAKHWRVDNFQVSCVKRL
jgi:hypothetical protein